MRKPRCPSEVYNDLDSDIVNLFSVLRDSELGPRLCEALANTPYARDEFVGSYTPTDDSLERARRTVVRSYMGFGSGGATGHRTSFRAQAKSTKALPAQDWARLPGAYAGIVERLRGVVIENRPADTVMERYDSLATLHYVDPPYPRSTRSNKGHYKNTYRHEMTDNDHRDLANTLRNLKGMVVLSGYVCDLYDIELYPDWPRYEKQCLADGAKERTEIIWINHACADALASEQLIAASHQPRGG